MSYERIYPYTAWRLMPSFKPAKVELVSRYATWRSDHEWDLDAKGKIFPLSGLFATRKDAVAYGTASLDEQEDKLRKMQASIEKKRAELAKEQAP